MSYIFPGLVIGAVYAILGNSITLTYSATGVLNLATGSMAFVVADTFYYLVAVVRLVAVGGRAPVHRAPSRPLLGLLLWAAVFRRMEPSDFVVQVVATIGIAVALPALAQIPPHGQVQQSPGIVPNGLYLVHFWFVNATRDQLAAISRRRPVRHRPRPARRPHPARPRRPGRWSTGPCWPRAGASTPTW